MLSTPSKNRTASRSQSQNMENTVEALKVDLAHDVRRSQTCNLDEFLKANLSFILKKESQEKKNLNALQEPIEELEVKIDAGLRAKAAEAKAQHEKNEAEGEGSNRNDSETIQWQQELDRLRAARQEILDHLFDQCLDEMLPVCADRELRKHLTDYSRGKLEVDLYSPFAKLSNRALDLMGALPLDVFEPVSKLDCRFHVNDPMYITTAYQGSTVSTKPDIVVTSRIVAEDIRLRSPHQTTQVQYDTAPGVAFDMRHILGSVEIKKGDKSLTVPLTKYNNIRQSNYLCDDKDLDLLYPVDGSEPAVVDTEVEGPATKRMKMDSSEQARPSSATGAGPSNTTANASNTSAGKKTKRSKSKRGSRQGKESRTETTYYPPNNSKNSIDARTQCAVYGMEMLSYAIGVHHAIVCLIIDCKFWIWYYDRQGVIQSDGIDFVQDLPRFLVLLFIFQRFKLGEWGVIPELNPNAVLGHNKELVPTTERRVTSRMLEQERRKDILICSLASEGFDLGSIGGLVPKKIDINLNDWLSHKPHCLAGRATAVLGASNPEDTTQGELACKISFPEIARENEGNIIEELRQEIEKDDETKHLSKHLPEVMMYGDMARYGTQRIRSLLKLSIQGCRILRALVLKKLAPITTVAGVNFVKAWLEIVKFHAFLWSRSVEHGDPSLWNMMYNKDLDCGVLSDYDLSISRRRPRVPGTDRTGTIPFMAIALLSDKYWNGQIERLYRHELEAFIWVLPFVFLRYQNGQSQRAKPVDAWMTSNYKTCAEKKSHFQKAETLLEMAELCQSDFKDHWELADALLSWLTDMEQIARKIRKSRGKADFSNGLTSIWPGFIEQLKIVAEQFPVQLGYLNNLVGDLELETPIWIRTVTG